MTTGLQPDEARRSERTSEPVMSLAAPSEFDLFLSRLMESLPDGALVVEADGRVVLANAQAGEIFGVPPESIGSIEAFVPELARGSHGAQVRRFVEGDGATRRMARGRVVECRRANGEQRFVEISLSPIQFRGQRRAFAQLKDVTERRASEQAHSWLAAIVENSDDAIIGLDLEGRVTSWNHGAERLFGYSAAEAVGVPFNFLSPPERLHESDDELGKIKQGQRVEPFETRRRCKDGREVDVSIALSVVLDAAGRIVGASKIARDITVAKQRDTELRRSNAELEQFAYVASHDLQEPLRMVANYTELLAERYRGKLDEKADKYITYASDGAHRMQRLVNDLLAFSRVGSEGRPLARVDARAVFERVRRTLQVRIEEAAATVKVGELPWVMADETQLGQLFQNLVSNALKFRRDVPPVVEVSATRDGARWVFRIADNGIGFEMKFAERIFQMFQRLNERDRYVGNGIGLAIAKRVVERHGGTIWVESTVGAGTTFFFTLPAAKEP